MHGRGNVESQIHSTIATEDKYIILSAKEDPVYISYTSHKSVSCRQKQVDILKNCRQMFARRITICLEPCCVLPHCPEFNIVPISNGVVSIAIEQRTTSLCTLLR